MANKTYAPLPFSYLTGGSAPETSPTYGVKTSVSHDPDDNTTSDNTAADKDPYSIYAGKANQPMGHAPLNNRVSMDITDPKLDVTDPYLLSTGRYSDGTRQDSSITEDPRYKNSVPSESDGGNVFFRSSGTSDNVFPTPTTQPHDQRPRLPTETDFYPAPSLQRTGAYTNPALDKITQDEDSSSQTGAKKLPRYKVGTDSVYQYYAGNEKDIRQGEGRGPNPMPLNAQGMDNANNPIWDKYYAGGSPAYPLTSPGTPGVRPTTKEDDFNTLLRHSEGSTSFGKGCCRSKTCAVLTAIIITAILCLGAGFAAGWFLRPILNSDTTRDTTTSIPSAAPSAGLSVSMTTAPPSSATTTTVTTRTATTSTASTTTTSAGAPGSSSGVHDVTSLVATTIT